MLLRRYTPSDIAAMAERVITIEDGQIIADTKS